ncbi:hypothetical protein RDWZM_008404 [Blomia tropicalis]|uniref:Glycoside hydrolase family 19 catalytic domain-containing protein n=1 Tax=Blomia tropicalis TaxID=40697 RepID=A0A9Q0M489_BLOTA|nr:hypothetical protein RDWZM_008404 [Blomia tropicalis]
MIIVLIQVLLIFSLFLPSFSIDQTANSPKKLITWKEFKKSLSLNNYPIPKREQYETVKQLAEQFDITTKEELAMFLAQVYWESLGLQHTKEIACASSKCPTNYRTGREKPGKYYYGRGYIQLTWLDNYENCSMDMYGDMRLVEEPDIVSDTVEGAWGSAFWYWHKYIHDIPEIHQGKFGYSTMAINGALECKGVYKIKAFRRYVVYVRVLEAFNLLDNVKPLQDGCYPMSGKDAPGFKLCIPIGSYRTQAGLFHWCNDNCNSADSNCPTDMCQCEP